MRYIETSIGNNGAKLAVYLQDTSWELPKHNIRPAMLVLPGGGYQFCSDREAEPIAMAYLNHGFNVFLLRYTVAGREASPEEMKAVFPKAFSDAKATMAYIRENAEDFHVDPNKVAAVGFSAGGHLAAALGTLSEDRPNGLVLGYAAVLKSINDRLGLESNLLLDAVDENTPPAFLLSTSEDEMVPSENSLLFAVKLAERKIPYELHVFKAGKHGIALGTKATEKINPAAAGWVDMSVDFLDQVWGE